MADGTVFEDKVGFGKHRDDRWIDVPKDYLIWIVDKATKVPEGSIEMAKGTLDRLANNADEPVDSNTTTPSNSEEITQITNKLVEKFDAKQATGLGDLPF